MAKWMFTVRFLKLFCACEVFILLGKKTGTVSCGSLVYISNRVGRLGRFLTICRFHAPMSRQVAVGRWLHARRGGCWTPSLLPAAARTTCAGCLRLPSAPPSLCLCLSSFPDGLRGFGPPALKTHISIISKNMPTRAHHTTGRGQ